MGVKRREGCHFSGVLSWHNQSAPGWLLGSFSLEFLEIYLCVPACVPCCCNAVLWEALSIPTRQVSQTLESVVYLEDPS